MSQSRIGVMPIILPANVSLRIEGKVIYIEGINGKSTLTLPPKIDIGLNTVNEKQCAYITINEETKYLKSQHGLFRTLVNNMVIGVSETFSIELLLKGVGYRCQVSETELTLTLGFSHPIKLTIPNGVVVTVESNVNIKITGPDKEKVGFFASQIRNLRPPEPYNGKGVLYKGETIMRKAGKSGKK